MVVDVEICDLKVGDNHPVRLMGAINLSLESFYKGSVVDTASLPDIAQRMIDNGASIIDIGARSTWPLASPVTKAEECRRLLPALKLLRENVDALISIDTVYSDIAKKALENGADIINDVAGFAPDGGMIDVVADNGCPAVVMAAEKHPGDAIGMDAIIRSLASILERSKQKGIDTDKLILDPAVGKWISEKTTIYDLEIIDQFERLKIFEKPLLAAISRKSFIGNLLNKPANERLYGSLAAIAIVVQKGAHIIRTHDIAETLDVVKIAAAVRSCSPIVEQNGLSVSILDISHPDDAAFYMKNSGITSTGSQIMKNKIVSRMMRINNISITEALIIKQEMLARGGDAALERDVISYEISKTDIIVIGTLLQIRKLADKLETQIRNLPAISKMIKETLKQESDIEYRYMR